ncbi:oxygenase MpaB family protein [Xanthomonas sp. AM6]|uniref:oxygenase MpaB family protein n=1 Tax=Xanthomonas sp. AM6 TaxID=2982531 RepID=UPI0021D8439D|nr:oxygenase MpaB family protein [Xanthomonas sp. AM6]UYB51865.1 oxygenase MpaB family protein [Xanthomonas sp. AM6]
MTAMLRTLTAPATAQIRRWVLGAFPRGHSSIDYDQPRGDAGLFGPDSVTWRIHAEFPGMLSGGLCALLLQTLHPLALAGVYDHSNFRDDLVGRLRRTTQFVAATSYAPQAEAQRLIQRVRTIHARIRGRTPDGRAYAADDPALLTWVHVTEAYGFLHGYRRYCRPVPEPIADRYYDEVRRVAEALGAQAVPASEREVQAYFAQLQPQLRVDARSRGAGGAGRVAPAGAGRGPVARPVPRRRRGAAAALGHGDARTRAPARRPRSGVGMGAARAGAAVPHRAQRRHRATRLPAGGDRAATTGALARLR